MPVQYFRGDVLRVDFDPAKGSEPNKIRPCVVIQNDIGNKYSPITIVAATTDVDNVPKPYPVDVPVSKTEGGLTKDSVIQCNLVRCVDKARIQSCTGKLTEVTMRKVDVALKISLALQ